MKRRPEICKHFKCDHLYCNGEICNVLCENTTCDEKPNCDGCKVRVKVPKECQFHQEHLNLSHIPIEQLEKKWKIQDRAKKLTRNDAVCLQSNCEHRHLIDRHEEDCVGDDDGTFVCDMQCFTMDCSKTYDDQCNDCDGSLVVPDDCPFFTEHAVTQGTEQS